MVLVYYKTFSTGGKKKRHNQIKKTNKGHVEQREDFAPNWYVYKLFQRIFI